MKYRIFVFIILLFTTGFIYGCSDGPEPINYGSDICAHCNMKIMDNRFAAEIVNTKSKAYKFDAAECMSAYLNENKIDVKNMYVTDFNNPGSFMIAGGAAFVISPKRKSPMGENLSAYKSKKEAQKVKDELGGEIYSWEELQNVIGK